MDSNFSPHQIDWTTEKAARLWSWIAAKDSYEQQSFGSIVGDCLIDFAATSGVRLDGEVLDFGCGPGFFLEKLLARNITCEGMDVSKLAAEMARERLSKFANFRGIAILDQLPTRYEAAQFRAVFMLETIEHILDRDLPSILGELHRITEPRGHLIISTPNEENLTGGETMCPECGCTYHRGQHVQRWSADRLTSSLTRHGFRTVRFKRTNLRPPSRLNILRDVVATLRRARPLNLLYVGQRM